MSESGICPNCGASVNLADPDKAKSFYCPFCSSVVDRDGGTAEKVSLGQGKPLPAKSALQIGLQGSINDKLYRITGRIRYRDIKDNSWWDEWLLLSEDGQYLWLTEDDWDFVLMKKYTPRVPVDPRSVGKFFVIDGQKLEVEDNSTARIDFFEGELTWKARIGETVGYIDAWMGEHTLYSCEYTDREINYYLGRELSAQQIYNCFNLGIVPDDALDDDYGSPCMSGMVSNLGNSPTFKLTLIFGFLFLISAFIAGLMGNEVSPKGKPAVSAESVLLGPYNLDKENGLYRINALVKGLSNRSVELLIEVLNEEKETVSEFNHEFYEEHGHDSDGYWSESSVSTDRVFLLREPGSYYIRISPDPPGTPNMTISLKEKVIDTDPLWVLSIISFIFPGIVLFIMIMSRSGDDSDDDD